MTALPRHASLCLVALLIALPGAPGPALAQEASGKVSLRFGWQPGLELRVEATRTRTRSAESSTTHTSTTRYTLVVGEAGENLRVRFTDPETVGAGGAKALPEEQAKIMDRLAELMPDFVVTREGAFVGLHDLPGFQQRLSAFLAEVMPPEVDPAVVARMQAMLTSEQFLHARVSEEWNAIVGAWAGADFTVGEPVTYSQPEPLGLLPGEDVKMNYSFLAESMSLCPRGGVDRACVQLSMRSAADSEDVKRVIDAFLAKLAPGQLASTPTFRTLEVVNDLTVTTEPGGLVPHAYRLAKTIRGTVDTPNGLQPVEQVDISEVRYTLP